MSMSERRIWATDHEVLKRRDHNVHMPTFGVPFLGLGCDFSIEIGGTLWYSRPKSKGKDIVGDP